MQPEFLPPMQLTRNRPKSCPALVSLAAVRRFRMPVNYLHSLLHRVEDGWDPIPSSYAASYAELAWHERSPKIVQDLESLLGGLAGKSVLDLGGGPGQYSILFAQHGADVTWHDISREYQAI